MRGLLLWLVVISLPAMARAEAEADFDLVKRAMERHFFQPQELTQLDKLNNAREVLSWLKTSKLDVWAKLYNRRSLGQPTAGGDQNGFGLQLLQQDNQYYLLPQIGSPNDLPDYRLYKVAQEPQDADWQKALTDNTLSIEPPFTGQQFEKGSFLLAPLRVRNGVLRIDDFVNPTLPESLRLARQGIESARIIDLRFNGGGRVDYAARLLKIILGEQKYFGSVDKKGQITRYGGGDDTAGQGADGTYVLISRHTASAAEWVARTLQYYGATVIGERSAGKCLLHGTYPVGNKFYFEFAIGTVQSAAASGYSHCDYGIVPNVTLASSALLQTDAAAIASTLRDCLLTPLDDNAADNCQALFISPATTDTDADVSREPLPVPATLQEPPADSEDNVADATQSTEAIPTGQVCLVNTSLWQLQIGLGTEPAKMRDMQISLVDQGHKVLLLDNDNDEPGQLVVRKIASEEAATALSQQLDKQYGVAADLVKLDRLGAYQKQINLMMENYQLNLVESAGGDICIDQQFDSKTAAETIEALDTLADFSASYRLTD